MNDETILMDARSTRRERQWGIFHGGELDGRRFFVENCGLEDTCSVAWKDGAPTQEQLRRYTGKITEKTWATDFLVRCANEPETEAS